VSAGKVEVLHASCKDYFIHAGCKRHITPQLGRGCRNRACQVRSWSFEEAGLDLDTGRWKIGPFAHTCASVVGVSVDPSVVGRDWSPVSSNKARGCCCRTPGDHRAPLQPRRAARRYLLRARGTAVTDSSASREPTPGGPGSGSGLRPGRKRFLCQLPLWFYMYIASASYASYRSGSEIFRSGLDSSPSSQASPVVLYTETHCTSPRLYCRVKEAAPVCHQFSRLLGRCGNYCQYLSASIYLLITPTWYCFAYLSRISGL
jgi:hypothetical protein